MDLENKEKISSEFEKNVMKKQIYKIIDGYFKSE
jgi:hypothetical protein